MGGWLSQPITSKMLIREGNSLYRIGRSDMQGWRLNMEDAMTVMLGMGAGREDWAFFGVFDGHAGSRASEFLGQQMHLRVCELADPFDPEQLTECVCKLDADFCTDEVRRGDGSTCVFAIVRPTNAAKTEFEVIVSNTGDSRVAIIRKDTGECVSMTEDHKPNDEAESERIYAAGGFVQMNRTDGQLAMSRAIGDWQYKQNPDLTQDKQKVIPTPDITVERMQLGDQLLVMCDGIVEQMTNQEAAAYVVKSMQEHNDPAKAVAELFTQSVTLGSRDNHSAILVDFADGREFAQQGPTFLAGPYHPYKNDSQFANLYIADAERYGIRGEKLFAAARKTEEELGVFETPSEPPQSAGRQYLRLLQQIQQNYNLQNMQLVPGGSMTLGGDDEQDEDDMVDGGDGGGASSAAAVADAASNVGAATDGSDDMPQ